MIFAAVGESFNLHGEYDSADEKMVDSTRLQVLKKPPLKAAKI